MSRTRGHTGSSSFKSPPKAFRTVSVYILLGKAGHPTFIHASPFRLHRKKKRKESGPVPTFAAMTYPRTRAAYARCAFQDTSGTFSDIFHSASKFIPVNCWIVDITSTLSSVQASKAKNQGPGAGTVIAGPDHLGSLLPPQTSEVGRFRGKRRLRFQKWLALRLHSPTQLLCLAPPESRSSRSEEG